MLQTEPEGLAMTWQADGAASVGDWVIGRESRGARGRR